MNKPSPARYRTTNRFIRTAWRCGRGSLLIWLDNEVTGIGAPGGSPGRSAAFPDVTVRFYLTVKVLFMLPLRQTTGMVASLLKMADLDWAVPDHTTLAPLVFQKPAWFQRKGTSFSAPCEPDRGLSWDVKPCPELGGLLAQLVDLKPLGLQLPFAGKSLNRIGPDFRIHLCISIQIPRCLCRRHSTILHERYRPKLALVAELPSFQGNLRLP